MQTTWRYADRHAAHDRYTVRRCTAGAAVSPDGSRVYAAAFTPQPTALASPLARTDPPFSLPPRPRTCRRAAAAHHPDRQFDGQHWVDELNRQFDRQILSNLPDKDVFVIDANGPRRHSSPEADISPVLERFSMTWR